jgi:hypothetical protein
MTQSESVLRKTLELIVANDENYAVRYGLVLLAVATAHGMGFASGFRVDPDESEWPVAFVELPTGQVSWHMPQHPLEWDGHTTAVKFDRINTYLALAPVAS